MKATIKQIKNIQNLNLITLGIEEIELTMLSLELQSELKVGSQVVLNVKATSVTLAKDLDENAKLSFENILTMEIASIEFGEILTSLNLKSQNISLESIITTSVAKKMQLQNADKVSVLINASDISIVEIL